MRWTVVFVAALTLVAGCSSGDGSSASTTTSAAVDIPVSVTGFGKTVTWSEDNAGGCTVGEVRVLVSDSTGATVAIQNISPDGEIHPNGQMCLSESSTIAAPVRDFYTVSAMGTGPVGFEWSAAGLQVTAAEAQTGVVIEARMANPAVVLPQDAFQG